jgi:predicted amidohydrolase YtcJ
VPEGEWIVLQQVFITRLREQRYPTLAELDAAAPRHPVLFRTGPDCALNSAGLREAKITRDSKVPDGVAGKIEFDAAGDPNGILRGYGNFTRLSLDSGRVPSDAEKRARTLELFRDYLATGLTTVCDRGANAGSIAMYEQMRAEGQLPLRLMLSYTIPTTGPMDGIRTAVRQIPAACAGRPPPHHRHEAVARWRDAHRQRVHARPVGREPDVRH